MRVNKRHASGSCPTKFEGVAVREKKRSTDIATDTVFVVKHITERRESEERVTHTHTQHTPWYTHTTQNVPRLHTCTHTHTTHTYTHTTLVHMYTPFD